MQLFQQMQREGMIPDKFTFVQVIKACPGLGSKTVGLFMNSSFKVVVSLMSLCAIAWWTCLQNVGAMRRLGECSTRCHSQDDIGTFEMQPRAQALFTKIQHEGV